jgi:hypothetical protein
MLGSSGVAAQLAGSQEGLSSMSECVSERVHKGGEPTKYFPSSLGLVAPHRKISVCYEMLHRSLSADSVVK